MPNETATIDWTTLKPGDKTKIVFDGKTIDVTYVRPGVMQKTASIFYIQDCITKEWLYCFPERLANMIAKGIDLANYKGRNTKAIERKALKEAKAAASKARQDKLLEAAKKSAEKIANAQAEVKQTEPVEQAAAPKPVEQAAAPKPVGQNVIKKAAKK